MYVKITNKYEIHNKFVYRDGLNELLEPFNDNETESCVTGGLYFTNIQNAHKYYSFGIYIRKINLPENDPEFKIIMDPSGDKWRANKIILGKKYSLCDPETYKILNLKTPSTIFLIECAIKEDNINSLDMLKKLYLIDNPGTKLSFYEKICYIAAAEKSCNVLMWAKNEGFIIFNTIYEVAASWGNIDVLQWALDNNDKYLSIDDTDDIINNAARRGHLDVLKWIHNKKCSDDNYVKYSNGKLYMYAVRNNHYKIIKWAHANNYIWHSPDSTDVNKKTDERILKWLVRNGHFIDKVYTIIAPINQVIKNNIDLLNWSCKNEKIFKNTCNNENTLLKIFNNYDSLKWMYNHDKQIFNNIIDNKIISIKIINKAASDGNLEMIKWMRENGSCWNEHTCKNTAKYDHFDCFQYLWLNNCYVDALNELSETTIRRFCHNKELKTCKDEIIYFAKTKHNYNTALNWITTQIRLSNNIIAGFDTRITELGNCKFCINFSHESQLRHNFSSLNNHVTINI